METLNNITLLCQNSALLLSGKRRSVDTYSRWRRPQHDNSLNERRTNYIPHAGHLVGKLTESLQCTDTALAEPLASGGLKTTLYSERRPDDAHSRWPSPRPIHGLRLEPGPARHKGFKFSGARLRLPKLPLSQQIYRKVWKPKLVIRGESFSPPPRYLPDLATDVFP